MSSEGAQIFKLIVSYILITSSEGARRAASKLIVESTIIFKSRIIFRDKPHKLIGEQFIASNNSLVGFQLVVESILILHSEGAQVASASLQTFADGDQAASQSDTSELIVTQLVVEFNLILHSEGARAPSSALIVGYRSSKYPFTSAKIAEYFVRE